jgi:VIT1/CCC1 family predicted Fe2+/Mn2+ transporter
LIKLQLHRERHLVSRIGWLRAAVLGANDGIVSSSSLIIGVAAASTQPPAILVAGAAGLVAGAMSMAAGEYVSVSSQSDTENADLARESKELANDLDAEVKELAGIYVKRGIDPATADNVARQLMKQDALAAHALDELGISEITTARSIQAALISAYFFTSGAALPLGVVILAPSDWLIPLEGVASLLFLALLGSIGARAGGAPILTATLRVTFWGALAMALTAEIGTMVGTAVWQRRAKRWRSRSVSKDFIRIYIIFTKSAKTAHRIIKLLTSQPVHNSGHCPALD